MILYFFFTEVKCKENTQITHMEETEKHISHSKKLIVPGNIRGNTEAI